MVKIKPLIKYHGGKYYLAKWIISEFPLNYEQMTFVDCCLGGANVLLQKKPSIFEIGNDLDYELIEMYKYVIHYNEWFKKIVYSQETFDWWKLQPDSWQKKLILHRMSRGGIGKDFAWSKRLRGGIPGDVNAWNNFVISLPKTIDRLKQVDYFTSMDICLLLQIFDDKNTLFYIDPPYIPSSRISKKVYKYEMDYTQHETLIHICKSLNAKVVISCYDNLLYRKVLKGWNMSKKTTINNSSQNKSKSFRIETIYKNF